MITKEQILECKSKADVLEQRYNFSFDGFDCAGFSRAGFDRAGFDRAGFDRAGNTQTYPPDQYYVCDVKLTFQEFQIWREKPNG
jgi:hypothetical protein